MNSIKNKINELKKEKDAVVLAHYYVADEVQAIADYVGDSYYLSKIAATVPNRTIVFCGVSFMGESAKIISPDKTVLMPDIYADCPMAHMADVEDIRAVREQYADVAVVCYINSTAEIKAYSDVCVTSSNALKIIKKLPSKNIYFIPDANLGKYLASQMPDKNFIFNNGFCCVHAGITEKDVKRAKEAYPEAKVLAHPECPMVILALADYVGSTKGIIEYATADEGSSFIICTEEGILFELKQKNPQKEFHLAGERQCSNMKKVTLQKVSECLEGMNNQVELDEALRLRAAKVIEKMLELAE